MFKQTVYGISAVISIASLWLQTRVTPDIAPLYQKLAAESAELRSHHALERHPIHQKREQVQKDIWRLDGEERVHFRLKSAESELVIVQKREKVELQEHLKDIECWVQGSVDRVTSTQDIYTFIAQEGLYSYPFPRFSVQTIDLALFRTSGNELPDSLFSTTPFLVGTASETYLDPTGIPSTFIVFDLQAQLQSSAPSFPLSAKQNEISFWTKKLTWQEHATQFEFSQNVKLEQVGLFELQGDNGTLICNEKWEPEKLVVNGNTRLISPHFQEKEAYATADSMIYKLDDGTLLLDAFSPKRVLFWQEGLCMSAPKVQIQWNPATKQESMQGMGDVRFSFNFEEQNFFQKFFPHFL